VNDRGELQRVFVQLQTMIKGPDQRPIKATVVPRENGTYDIFCTPPIKGQYSVQLLENAEMVSVLFSIFFCFFLCLCECESVFLCVFSSSNYNFIV
jgi:hypothetical protein